VFVIVSNFFINRVGKVGPSSHSSVSIPETSAASHTDQGKEAPNELIRRQTKYKTFSWLNSCLLFLLFLLLLILVYILLKVGLKIATDTLLQVVCATVSILYQNLLIFVIYPQPSNEKLAQDSKTV